jgi:hypothetical protein
MTGHKAIQKENLKEQGLAPDSLPPPLPHRSRFRQQVNLIFIKEVKKDKRRLGSISAFSHFFNMFFIPFF